MNSRPEKTQENESQSMASAASRKQSHGNPAFQFVDNRPEAIAQRKLQEMANNNPQAKQAAQLQAMADKHSVRQKPIQKKKNNTGLPDNLKSGIENLSGYSMDDVKVHYNSGKPAQLQAHAYARGTDIHLAPTQEKHLPHEAWHVVQQAQGRVRPTTQMKEGVAMNDDRGLESEADKQGARALQIGGDLVRPSSSVVQTKDSGILKLSPVILPGHCETVVQRVQTAYEFLTKYWVSNDIELPFFKEKFFAEKVDGEPPVEKMEGQNLLAIQSIIPTHPDGKGIMDIAEINVGGFKDKKDAKLRYGLSVGANAYAGLDKAESGEAAVKLITKNVQNSFFPMNVVAFTWRKVWKRINDNCRADQDKDFWGDFDGMSNEEKSRVRRQETKTQGNNTFIYGAVREALIKAKTTQQVSKRLKDRSQIGRLYYHIADDDAVSLTARSSRGIFDIYASEIDSRLSNYQQPPILIGGGYRIRGKGNPKEPGDAELGEGKFGIELAEFASDIDQSVRAAMASVDPRIPYFSESNLLVDQEVLVSRIKYSNNLVSGEIFGKNTFESNNLKRFLDLYSAEVGSEDAQKQSEFLPKASLITGTKGGGIRFLAYNLKAPKNYLKIIDEHLIKEYSKAIATSQNVGSPANLAINIHIFFQQKFQLNIPVPYILARFLNYVMQYPGAESPLYRALSKEGATKKMNSEYQTSAPEQFEEEILNLIGPLIDTVSVNVVTAHINNFNKIRGVIESYVEARTFENPGNPESGENGCSTCVVAPDKFDSRIGRGSIVKTEEGPKEVVGVKRIEVDGVKLIKIQLEKIDDPSEKEEEVKKRRVEY